LVTIRIILISIRSDGDINVYYSINSLNAKKIIESVSGLISEVVDGGRD
jgi:hypothetical protein